MGNGEERCETVSNGEERWGTVRNDAERWVTVANGEERWRTVQNDGERRLAGAFGWCTLSCISEPMVKYNKENAP